MQNPCHARVFGNFVVSCLLVLFANSLYIPFMLVVFPGRFMYRFSNSIAHSRKACMRRSIFDDAG